MKDRFGSVGPLCLLFAGLSFIGTAPVVAQDQTTQVHPPPKVLEIITEDIKPGQAGSPHQKTEAAFAQAMRDAKSPSSYIGMDALTGKTRAVFFVGYDSFADLQKDMDTTQANKPLASALDSATIADGALLESVTTSVYSYRDDFSLRGPVDITKMRYFEISIFHVRSGHEHDWDTLVKLYMKAFDAVPNAHWAVFEKEYGADSANTFIIVTPMRSLAEVDQEIADDKKLPSQVGEAQLQMMRELGASTIESSESHLFAINPKMSYVPSDWDPSFWGQK
jgi:hypothetical protein